MAHYTHNKDYTGMRRPRHPLARFEEHSLALLTVLAMGSTGVAAQTREPASEGHFVQTQAASAAMRPVAQRNASAEQAFARADANGDSKLSRDEAQRLPAVWQRFDDIDADNDLFISRDEFHRGIAN